MRRALLYPLLFVVCGGLSAGLLLWSGRQAPPPGWGPPAATQAPTLPQGVPQDDKGSAAPSEPPPQLAEKPDAPPEPETEPAPAAATPPPPSDEELLGPLPAKGAHAVEDKHALLPPPGAIAAVDPADFGSLSARPAAWPPVVKLLKPLRLPVFLNGAQAGSVLVPAGTVVALRKVAADGTVEVAHARSFATLPARDTDLSARVTALLRSGTAAAPVSTAAATPAPAPAAPTVVVPAPAAKVAEPESPEPSFPISFPR